MKELFLTKCIIDFKIHYHLNVSPTTINTSAGELMTELLPFAIEFHNAMPTSVYKIFSKWARDMMPNALTYGFELTPLEQRKQDFQMWLDKLNLSIGMSKK